MKRIVASLFVVVAIVAGGILATGAYFQATDTANNYTFTTGSASLVFGFCPGTNADCATVTPTLTNYTFVTSSLTGPDQAGTDCMVVKNSGQYLLHLTSSEVVASESPVVAYPHGMQDAFQVESQLTNSTCADPSGYAEIYSWQSARSAQAAGNVAVTDLAPGASIYILLRNRWDSSWNQNALQVGAIHINTTLTGTTN